MERLDDPQIIPLEEERVRLEKRVVEVAEATLSIVTHEHSETLKGDLLSEAYVVERRPIGRLVDVSPEVRTDGDSTIYPVVEEVLVKRLMLREEIRVTPNRTLTPFDETVTLRQQQASIERREPRPHVLTSPINLPTDETST